MSKYDKYIYQIFICAACICAGIVKLKDSYGEKILLFKRLIKLTVKFVNMVGQCQGVKKLSTNLHVKYVMAIDGTKKLLQNSLIIDQIVVKIFSNEDGAFVSHYSWLYTIRVVALGMLALIVYKIYSAIIAITIH